MVLLDACDEHCDQLEAAFPEALVLRENVYDEEARRQIMSVFLTPGWVGRVRTASYACIRGARRSLVGCAGCHVSPLSVFPYD